MSNQHQRQFRDDAVSEAELILKDLRFLRDQIVAAWQDRGVLLSRQEQAMLHAEIKQTCELLENLTRHP